MRSRAIVPRLAGCALRAAGLADADFTGALRVALRLPEAARVVLRDPVLARVVLRVDVLRALLRLPRLGVVAMAYLSGSLHECGPDHDSCRNPVRHFGQ